MWRLVDIGREELSLALADNSLSVLEDKREIQRIPLSDIGAIILHSYRMMISKNIIVALAESGIPLVYCDQSHMPVTISLPVAGHFRQAERAALQAEAALPTKKQLWKQIIRSKIREQARTIAKINGNLAESLIKLAQNVQSGDKGNVEAVAARLYWPCLMGETFKRERFGDDINGALNYGYTILRSAIARAVVAAGLNPSLGLFHRNKLNNFCLVDDLLEPFRPLVDRIVYEEKQQWSAGLDKEGKARLAGIIQHGIAMPEGIIGLTQLFFILANSLVDVFAGKANKLILPDKIEFADQYALGL